MEGDFTEEARARWAAISPDLRERLLRNVWCSHCTGETTIVDYSGTIQSGNLVLEGSCKACRGSVSRVIEGQ